MSKSILITDTPNSCWKCDLIKSCKVIPRNQSREKWESIHPQCPLQPTTELLEVLDKLNGEVDWSQSNIEWEETYLATLIAPNKQFS